jgi:Mn-dependent DtxR family transcriptional regulator
MAMSDKTKSVLEYLKGIGNENVTTADIAEALGLEKKSVEGVVTSGLQRKGLAERVPAQIETTDENGNKKYVDVKFVKLTAEGKAFRPGIDDVEKPADAE